MAKTTKHGGASIQVFDAPRVASDMVRQAPAELPEPIDQDDPYAGLTNDELRRELTERDLSTVGNKAELIDRLLDDDTAPE